MSCIMRLIAVNLSVKQWVAIILNMIYIYGYIFIMIIVDKIEMFHQDDNVSFRWDMYIIPKIGYKILAQWQKPCPSDNHDDPPQVSSNLWTILPGLPIIRVNKEYLFEIKYKMSIRNVKVTPLFMLTMKELYNEKGAIFSSLFLTFKTSKCGRQTYLLDTL